MEPDWETEKGKSAKEEEEEAKERRRWFFLPRRRRFSEAIGAGFFSSGVAFRGEDGEDGVPFQRISRVKGEKARSCSPGWPGHAEVAS